jgi:hypothetical protein
MPVESLASKPELKTTLDLIVFAPSRLILQHHTAWHLFWLPLPASRDTWTRLERSTNIGDSEKQDHLSLVSTITSLLYRWYQSKQGIDSLCDPIR